MSDSHRPAKRISFMQRVTRILTVALFVLMAALLLLGLGEFRSIRGLRDALAPRHATIGLLAGHWQHDSGAVCPDGLEEVEITVAVAHQVADVLRQEGYHVVVLPEYSPRLDGFRAGAFLSIHADSCVDLSGFKVARMRNADDPAEEDRLVETLYRTYAEATGLTPHYDSITEDMRQYHALRRIARDTPGAIIELGFMGGDRELLTEQQDRVAVGIADGLVAFLRDQDRGASRTD